MDDETASISFYVRNIYHFSPGTIFNLKVLPTSDGRLPPQKKCVPGFDLRSFHPSLILIDRHVFTALWQKHLFVHWHVINEIETRSLTQWDYLLWLGFIPVYRSWPMDVLLSLVSRSYVYKFESIAYKRFSCAIRWAAIATWFVRCNKKKTTALIPVCRKGLHVFWLE